MLTVLKGSQNHGIFAELLPNRETTNILCALRAGCTPRIHPSHHAGVAELVDAPDSKSGFFGSAGSIPAPGTISEIPRLFMPEGIIDLAADRLCYPGDMTQVRTTAATEYV